MATDARLVKTLPLVSGEEFEALRSAVVAVALKMIETGAAAAASGVTMMALARAALDALQSEGPDARDYLTVTIVDPILMDTLEPTAADASPKAIMMAFAHDPLASVQPNVPASDLETVLANVALTALDTMVIVPRRGYGGDHPALDPRLQRLPRHQWESANDPFGDRLVAQARLRCGMRDCPGDLGRVSLTRSSETINGATDHLVFEPARGLVQGTDGVWAEGKRAERARKSGTRPLGRRASPIPQDWLASKPLGPFEVPAVSVGLTWRGGVTEIRCPACRRLIRLQSRVAYEELVDVASTV